MLINWFTSSVSEHTIKSSLTVQELRRLGISYCTHLLTAGVLKPINDCDAPAENIFRTDMMYYWAHSEAPQSQTLTAGKIQNSIKWPPSIESPQKVKQTHLQNDLLKNKDESEIVYDNGVIGTDLNIEEAKLIIKQLKNKCENLQHELEILKTFNDIDKLRKNANRDFYSPAKCKDESNFLGQYISPINTDTTSVDEEFKISNENPVINIPDNVNHLDVCGIDVSNSIISDIDNSKTFTSDCNSINNFGKRSDDCERNYKINENSGEDSNHTILTLVPCNIEKDDSSNSQKNENEFSQKSTKECVLSPKFISPLRKEIQFLRKNENESVIQVCLNNINSTPEKDSTLKKIFDNSSVEYLECSPIQQLKDVTLKDATKTDTLISKISSPSIKESSVETNSVSVLEMGFSSTMSSIEPSLLNMEEVSAPLTPTSNSSPAALPMLELGSLILSEPNIEFVAQKISGTGEQMPIMLEMGPPPPPMPGIVPLPPPMPEMGPPPPPMPGMVPPPPPVPGITQPPPSIPNGGSAVTPGLPPLHSGSVSVSTTVVAPPPPSMSGPVPFPAPPIGGWNTQRAALRKTPVVPSVPMKPLYWTRILAPAPVAEEESEVKPLWADIEEASLDNIDEFADLFSRQVVTRELPKKKIEAKTKIQPVKILDSKRSQNVGILAQSLHVDFSEIENAIYNFDTSVVSLEALHQIYELRATDEELSLIKEHLSSNSDVPLDKPEAFLYELSGIPNFAEIISCFMFQAEFEDSISTIMHKLDNLKHTCEFLMTNEHLKRLFAIILALGNYMNGGNGQRGQADGFGLEILSKLRDVKSKESTVTLLHFTVRTYMRKSGGALSEGCVLPVPEPGDISRSADIDFADVADNLKVLAAQLQVCRAQMKKVVEADEATTAQGAGSEDSTRKRASVFREKMSALLERAGEKLKTEGENLEECRGKFAATVKFYQYRPRTGKPGTCEPKEFFGLWLSFCSDFKDIFKKEEQFAIKEKLKEAKKRKEENKAAVKPKKEGGLKARLQKLAMKS